MNTTDTQNASESAPPYRLNQIALQIGDMVISDLGEDGGIQIPAPEAPSEGVLLDHQGEVIDAANDDGPPRFVPVVIGALKVTLLLHPDGSAKIALDPRVGMVPAPSEDAEVLIGEMAEALNNALNLSSSMVLALMSGQSPEAWMAESIVRRTEVLKGEGYEDDNVADLMSLEQAVNAELDMISLDSAGVHPPTPEVDPGSIEAWATPHGIADAVEVIEGASAASEISDDG